MVNCWIDIFKFSNREKNGKHERCLKKIEKIDQTERGRGEGIGGWCCQCDVNNM